MAITIIQKKIADIIHPKYNPRQIKKSQFEQLKKSLETFEAVEPAIINIFPGRENIIIGGNQRIRAAESLGWTEFPCVEISLDEEKEKELNVRLNANTGEWDFDLLANNFEKEKLLDWGLDVLKEEKPIIVGDDLENYLSFVVNDSQREIILTALEKQNGENQTEKLISLCQK
jgi:ParB-like chromosome segregation protein Spo0J